MAGPAATTSDPRSSIDEVIEEYKKDVDRTLLRENLKKTPDQRVRDMAGAARSLEALRESVAAAIR